MPARKVGFGDPMPARKVGFGDPMPARKVGFGDPMPARKVGFGDAHGGGVDVLGVEDLSLCVYVKRDE